MIKFYVPERSTRRASVRFRATVPLTGMREEDGYIEKVEQAKLGELIVLAKNVNVADVKFLINNKIKFIFDICDDKWNRYPELYNYACQNANLITTTCELLQIKIKEYTNKTAFIIPDPTEREREAPNFDPKEHIKISWFGGRKSFSLFNWDNVVEDIQKVTNNFSIHAICNKPDIHAICNKPDQASKRLSHLIKSNIMNMYHWDYDLQGKLVRESDLVLLPLIQNEPLVWVKSPNRVIDAIQQGKYVITNGGVESYRALKDYIHIGDITEGLKWALNNKEQVIEKIKKGQKYVLKHHSPKIIGQRWIETEKLV